MCIRDRFILGKYDLKKITVPPCGYVFSENPPPGTWKGINDQFGFGPLEYMLYYCDVFEKLVEFPNKGLAPFCTHAILAQHLINGKIPVDFQHMPIFSRP